MLRKRETHNHHGLVISDDVYDFLMDITEFSPLDQKASHAEFLWRESQLVLRSKITDAYKQGQGS